MASYNFLFMLIFLCFATTIKAQEPLIYLNLNCSTTNVTTANTTFQSNLKILLSSLLSHATGNTEFYNTTVTGSHPSDSVYGLFMCRGDVTSQLCHQCIFNATQQLSSDCSLSKQGVNWYDQCMVRYSDHSFFSTVDTTTATYTLRNTHNVSNPESFNPVLFSTMNEVADKAAHNSSNKFATKEELVSNDFRYAIVYSLAQCTPDLSPHDCRKCLSGAISQLPLCCDSKQGGRFLYTSCNVRYELYLFYRLVDNFPPTPPHALLPVTNTSQQDSEFSEQSFYLSHNCSGEKTLAENTTLKLHLTTLLSNMYSHSLTSDDIFYKQDVNGTVFGLFMCRGDVTPSLCGQCVQNATRRILSECHSFQEAIVWYSHCLLRYSYQSISSKFETSPIFLELNVTNTSDTNQEGSYFFIKDKLTELSTITGNNLQKYATNSFRLNDLQTLYSLVQCTQDLSSDDCKSCLGDMIENAIPWPFLISVGGRVLYPSCNLRFELFQFYRDGKALPPNPNSHGSTSPLSEKGNSKRRTIILIVVPVIIIVVILFYFGYYYLLKGNKRKSRRTILRENLLGLESANLEPLQFDLVQIEAATSNFSNDNYIGKGGFGEVYKGILLDGRLIAVKRLSKSSKQGVDEFKNEVLLIARLQHRNLVTFIGFCIEEQENILIYEYVPKKSLDYFLFDSQRQKSLCWVERYNIIGGIARGILYLHEHSRLKVIHRDLKPSNVLLDENMIPKISDFGLARIIEISQDQGSTNRIVGTYGYMSPEYAMLGQFSEKSDVFSFGVMILEIVTGKKNLSSHESHIVPDGLLNYVWRLWKDRIPLTMLDPIVEEDYSEDEAIKCIQIGLLCIQHNPDARPTMATIVSYLSNYSMDLPPPQKPAFFLPTGMNLKAQESTSTLHGNSSTQCSINEISMSVSLPR